MKANPGGQLAIDEIIGRDDLCNAIKETLISQSVRMTAERRIGKTSVMLLLEKKPADNWVPIYTDLEKIQDAEGFANEVDKSVQQYLSTKSQCLELVKKGYETVSKAEIKGSKLPTLKVKSWQETLEESIKALTKEQQESGQQVIFLWDEFPYMLDNILSNDGEQIAKNVLDTLRALRKDCENFRILITGSIGLHHVLSKLQKSGYKNEPFNDMHQTEVLPLEQKYAIELSKRLIKGEAIPTDNIDKVAGKIATLTDNFPFYIQSVVKQLKTSAELVTESTVENTVLQSVNSDHDPWELRHYDKRIKDYYPHNEKLIKLILDEVALSPSGISPKNLLNNIKNQIAFDDIETLRTLLRSLSMDHYLIKNPKKEYTFKFTLIQRWWLSDRELAGE